MFVCFYGLTFYSVVGIILLELRYAVCYFLEAFPQTYRGFLFLLFCAKVVQFFYFYCEGERQTV